MQNFHSSLSGSREIRCKTSPHFFEPPCTIGRVENQKSLIFFKSQAGFHAAHKNKAIHYVLKTQNICFHIGKGHFMGLILRSLKY